MGHSYAWFNKTNVKLTSWANYKRHDKNMILPSWDLHEEGNSKSQGTNLE